MKRVMYALYYYITLSVYDIIVDHSQAKGTHHSFQRGSSTSSDLCQMGKQSCEYVVWRSRPSRGSGDNRVYNLCHCSYSRSTNQIAVFI